MRQAVSFHGLSAAMRNDYLTPIHSTTEREREHSGNRQHGLDRHAGPRPSRAKRRVECFRFDAFPPPRTRSIFRSVQTVQGNLGDRDALRRALNGVSTLFLLAPNAAGEFTQLLQALSIARESDVKGIVYLSVFKGEEYVDVPRFSSKRTAERMIERIDMPATIPRPAYFIQNDVRQKEPLLKHGLFGMPIGSKGILIVDVRDIGEAAARELQRHEYSADPLPRETYELVGPDALTADSITAIWSDALGREIRYGGDDL